jgi:hypothetical protein
MNIGCHSIIQVLDIIVGFILNLVYYLVKLWQNMESN